MIKKILKSLLIIFVIFLVVDSIWFYIEVKKNDGSVGKAAVSVLEKAADTVTHKESIYFLLLGVNDNLGQSLTDTIMVCGYNPDAQKAFLISIPRDTFVGKNVSQATASDKINSLYSNSPEKLMKKVSEITGIDLEYYVCINNEAVIELVDTIGGVEFDVPIDMNYDDKTQNLHIHLKAGLQTINGEKAEALLRFRHNNDGTSYDSEYGDNDYGRMKTRKRIFDGCAKSDS